MYTTRLLYKEKLISNKNKETRDYYDKKCKTMEDLELNVKGLKESLEEFPELTNYQIDLDAV